MQLSSALLCDFAQVREGLLFVSSGGITRVWRESFPAPAAFSLAIVVDVHQMEAAKPHEMQVIIQGEDGNRIADATLGFQMPPDMIDQLSLGPQEFLANPVVLDLRDLEIPSAGMYAVEILLDGMHNRTLNFRADLPPEGLFGPRPEAPPA